MGFHEGLLFTFILNMAFAEILSSVCLAINDVLRTGRIELTSFCKRLHAL